MNISYTDIETKYLLKQHFKVRLLFSFILSFTFISAYAQIPAGYYDSASGLTGNALKTALYNIIKGHTEYPYTSTGTDVWDILKETDKDPVNAANVILLYTGWSVDAEQEYNSGNGWSREHVWAKSRGDFGTTEGPGTDTHHLRPADVSVNSARNNRWFAECDEQYFDDGGTIPTDSWTSSTEWVWKPRDVVKGDVARMIFYMATRYEGELGEPDLEVIDYLPADNNTNLPIHALLSDLISWHEQDPVSDWERDRNDIIHYNYQHNRNPYIDHPEWVCEVFGTGCSVENPSSYTAVGATTTQIDLSWVLNANSDNVMIAWNTSNTFGLPSGSYSVGNSISGGGTVLYLGNGTSYSHSGLSQQNYYYKIWSYDGVPEYSSGIEKNVAPLVPEPTNNPTNFIVSNTSSVSINLTWTDATGGTLPYAYLIKASTGTVTDPVDGTHETDGTLIKNVLQAVETVNFTGLNSSTTYNFKIYPYTNSGSDIDYKTDSPLSASGTTDELTADCASDLLISEYCEGTSYNKYIEVYNKTGSTIDLDNYRLIKGTNGAAYSAIISFSSGATLANDEVYIVSHSSANATILAAADNTDGDANFNGNDAIALQKTIDGGSNWTSTDVIGIELEDPGTAWTVAGVANATSEHTMVRKSSIFDANTDWVASAGTDADDSEWIVYAQDEFSYMGAHSMNCVTIYTWQGDDGTDPNDWQTAENWDLAVVPTSTNDVSIPLVTDYPVIDDGTTVAQCFNLEIVNGANITIASNGRMTVSGTVTNNNGSGGIIIKSDASGTASLIHSTVDVPATAERYLSADNWHYLFTPLDNVDKTILTTTSIGEDNPNFYKYNEASADYWDVTTTYGTSGWNSEAASILINTNSYSHQSYENRTYSLTGGNLFAGQKDFNLTYTVNGTGPVNLNGVTSDWDEFEGWNLIGNPYASAFDWDHPGINKTNIGNVIYYYDDTADQYKYYGGGTPVSQGISVNGGSRYIPAGQGFFVKATNSGVFSIPNDARVHNDQAFWKKAENINNLIRLQIESKDYTDEIVLRALKGTTYDYDIKYDALKLFPNNKDNPYLYSLNFEKDKRFAINSIDNTAEKKNIPLGIYTGTNDVYKLRLTVNSFEYCHVWLEDIYAETKINLLKQSEYIFLQAQGNDTERFYLHIDTNEPPRVKKIIKDQKALINIPFKLQVPKDLFIETDFEDYLSYSAQLSDGSKLTDWLSFDSDDLSLYGTPDQEGVYKIKLKATDIFGAFNTVTFSILVEEQLNSATEIDKQFQIYPNPVSDDLFISSAQPANFKIINIYGKLISEGIIRNTSNRIDVSYLKSGIYIIEIQSTELTVFRKFVKKE